MLLYNLYKIHNSIWIVFTSFNKKLKKLDRKLYVNYNSKCVKDVIEL